MAVYSSLKEAFKGIIEAGDVIWELFKMVGYLSIFEPVQRIKEFLYL